MAGIRVAVQQAPRRVKVTDSDALLEHAKILQLRSRLHDGIDQAMRRVEQRVEEARLKLREAEVAAEQVKLALEAIGLQEQGAVVVLGDGALREGRASAQSPSTGLRTGFDPSRCLRLRTERVEVTGSSRRREKTAPPQDDRICEYIYEMLHLSGVSKTKN